MGPARQHDTAVQPARRLTATYYAEWVLGTVRDNAPLQVVCDYDAEAGAVFSWATNRNAMSFGA